MSDALVVQKIHAARGDRMVLRGVSLALGPGEVCALMGTSGAGKTTVLRTIAALQPFSEGTIAVDGFRLDAGPLPSTAGLRALRQRVGMVFQAHALFEHLSALENVVLAPMHAFGQARLQAEETAMALLEELGVAARASAYPHELSGGEAQRVAIARALAPDPQYLLLDEPTSALDPARRGALGDTLRALAAEGRGLLLATHDVEFALACADRVAILADGVVVQDGKPADVLIDPQHPATRELLSTPVVEGSTRRSAARRRPLADSTDVRSS
jgi:ABC-type polar amino acid transport system ATPase subunit